MIPFMADPQARVVVVTGASRGIGAAIVAGYRRLGWAVVANSLTIKPSEDPDVLTVAGDVAEASTTVREAVFVRVASHAATREPEPSKSSAVPPRRLYNVAEAARVLGIGRSTVYALFKSGELDSVTIGRRPWRRSTLPARS